MGKVFKYIGILFWFLKVFVFVCLFFPEDIILSKILAKVFGDGFD